MNGLANIEWVQWALLVGGILLVIGLIGVAWWALFGDRARGRRRCPRCWYELTYIPGLRCPECGHDAPSEEHLQRTRRKWLLGVGCIMLCTLIGITIAERASQRGWLTYVPNTVLITALPYADDGTGPLFREVETRIYAGALSDEQIVTVYRYAAEGDAGAPPPSDAWVRKYGAFIRRSAQAVISRLDEDGQAQVFEHLYSIPPRFDFVTRTEWPIDSRPIVHVVADDWWPTLPELRVTVTPQVEGAEPQVFERWLGPIQTRSFGLELPTLPPGEHEVPIEIEVERRFSIDVPWQPIDTQELSIDVAVAHDGDARPTPVSSPSMDDAIAQVVSSGLIKWPNGSLPVRIRIDHRHTRDPQFADTAVALRIEVFRNGDFGRRLDIWWMGGVLVDDRQYAWEVPVHDDSVLVAPDQPDDVWTVRATGDPNLALLVDGADYYWAGQLEVEVPVRSTRGGAPARGWVRPPEESEESGARPADTDDHEEGDDVAAEGSNEPI